MKNFTPAPLLPTVGSASGPVPPLSLTGQLVADAAGHDDQPAPAEGGIVGLGLITGTSGITGKPTQATPAGEPS